jgi:putative acetyltransferase
VTASEVVLRPASAGDADSLLRVWRAAVEATHAFLRPGDLERYAVVVRSAIPTLTVTVAERRGAVLGFAGCAGARLEMLFVDPAVHGQGVGSALLARATAGHRVVELDVNEQNPQARAFYARRGFVEVGRSAHDGAGRPYPLLHLRRADGVAPSAQAAHG